MTEDLRTPEGKLIGERREALRPKLSQNAAAKMIGLSGNRWRHIEKGYQTVAAGVRTPVVGPPDTLAKMAKAIGVTADELTAVGRADAAAELEALDTKHQEWLTELADRMPRLPRGAPNAPVYSEVEKALGTHPVLPGTLLPMSNSERRILSRVRSKILPNVDDQVETLTEEETQVLTKFIEDDELRTLHVRIDWLPRTEQLEVSALVNELELQVEKRWVADGYNNESERLPDYAQPNPLPVMGNAPDPRDFPSQVPMFIEKEKSDALETTAESDAPGKAGKAQEVSGPAAGQDSEDWASGWSPPGDEDTGMGGDEEGQEGDQLSGG